MNLGIKAALTACLISVGSGAILEANAGPVLVESGNERGRGLARAQGNECFVLAPAHLIKARQRRPNAQINFVGPGSSRGIGEFDRLIGTEADDIALLRVTSNGGYICDEREARDLKSKTSAVLALRENSGDLTYVPVEVLGSAGSIIDISERSEFFGLQQSMSGGLLVENGRSQGLLLSTTTERPSRGQVKNLEYIAGLTGPWVKDPSSDVGAISASLEILQKSVEMKPSGDIGHIAAIEALVEAGSALSGADLRGLMINNARLAGARFDDAQLAGAKLTRSNLKGASFNDIRAGFSNFQDVIASKASIERARFYFAEAEKSVFNDVSASRSNWFGAKLQGADFSGADLTGASFAFADVRDVNFSGADLSGAIFAGAVTTGANFDSATFNNTDFTSVVGQESDFTRAQMQGMCARVVADNGIRVTAVEIIPSTRYDSGKNYEDINYGSTFYQLASGLSNFARCDKTPEANYPAGRQLLWMAGQQETYVQTLKVYYESALIDRANRRSYFKSRVQGQKTFLESIRNGGQLLQAPSETHAAATRYIQSKISSVDIVEPAILTNDVLLLMLIDEGLLELSQEEWFSLASARISTERIMGTDSWGSSSLAQNLWPKIFPETFTSQQLRADDVELFIRWSMARADRLPKVFSWPTRHSRDALPRMVRNRETGTNELHFFSATATPGQVTRARRTPTGPAAAQAVPQIVELGGGIYKTKYFLKFEKPLADYAVISTGDVIEGFKTNSRLSSELTLEVLDLQSVPAPESERYTTSYVTVTVRPLRAIVYAGYQKGPHRYEYDFVKNEGVYTPDEAQDAPVTRTR